MENFQKQSLSLGFDSDFDFDLGSISNLEPIAKTSTTRASATPHLVDKAIRMIETLYPQLNLFDENVKKAVSEALAAQHDISLIDKIPLPNIAIAHAFLKTNRMLYGKWYRGETAASSYGITHSVWIKRFEHLKKSS